MNYAPSTDFRVDLEIFRGPMDLLLYLVRKHEVDIVDIPVAVITDQFLGYLEILHALDINAVGDFLEMASTLAEIKSRMLLPRGGEEQEELEDPRQELVRQLLEYKKFKDAASLLEEHSRSWQDRFPRLTNDLMRQRDDLAEQPLHEVELWDLVSALGRIMRDHQAPTPSSIVYDETPIHVYMERIHARLMADGRLAFTDMFEPGMHKSTMIGMMLAILELVRHHSVRAEQNAVFGEIWILPPIDGSGPLDLSSADGYEHGQATENTADDDESASTKPR